MSFQRKFLTWIFFSWNLKKAIAIFSSQYRRIFQYAKFYAKIWPKKWFIWVFSGWNLKSHCHIWNQRPRICLNAKFGAKIKILKFKTKKCLNWVFWAANLNFWTGIWKNYWHTWNDCPWICLGAKFGAKIKILKSGTKNALFEYFWIGIWK